MRVDQLDEGKKERIIQASMEEFAKGYANASTNRIVEKAGISKGLLFYYFGSKKDLFFYVLNWYIERAYAQYQQEMAEVPSDVFERLLALAARNFRLYKEDPVGTRFYLNALKDPPPEIKEEVEAFKRTMYKRNYEIFFSGLDFSSLRPGVDPKKAISLIQFVLDGLRKQFVEHCDLLSLDLQIVQKEFREYIELLKKGLCRRS